MSKPCGVGLFGGTFDPVHRGHLQTALELKQALQLEQMRMVPCATPYHREQPTQSIKHRLAMLELAVDANPDLVVDSRELQRTGPSYTIDTLVEVRAEIGQQTPLILCLGMDAFANLASWHCWKTIPELAHIVVVCRPGFQPPKEGAVAEILQQRKAANSQALRQSACGTILIAKMSLLAVSATQIRESVKQGLAIKNLLPEAVEHYIWQHQLYSKQEGVK